MRISLTLSGRMTKARLCTSCRSGSKASLGSHYRFSTDEGELSIPLAWKSNADNVRLFNCEFEGETCVLETSLTRVQTTMA